MTMIKLKKRVVLKESFFNYPSFGGRKIKRDMPHKLIGPIKDILKSLFHFCRRQREKYLSFNSARFTNRNDIGLSKRIQKMRHGSGFLYLLILFGMSTQNENIIVCLRGSF